MKKDRTLFFTQGAAIAAMYVVLTLITNLFGLANGFIQFRLSEILTVLPVVSSAAVPGLFAGCLLSNFITGCPIWDIVIGSLATLVGALFTRVLGKKNKYLAPLPPVIANAFAVAFTYSFIYPLGDKFYILVLTVGLGELVVCGIGGMLLLRAVEKNRIFIK